MKILDILPCGHQSLNVDDPSTCSQCEDDDNDLPALSHIQGLCPGGSACTCDTRDDGF